MTQTQSQPPEKEFRAGPVKAAIWRRDVEESGRTVVQYSVRVQKRYRDAQTGEWKTTDCFFPNDLPKLQLVAAKAYEYVCLKESEDSAGG